MDMENIKISKLCGLCQGCKNVIETTKAQLNKGKNVTLFKEVVHNKNVNKFLNDLGAQIKTELTTLNNKELVIIRAHGEPPKTFEHLNENGIKFKDCTCPNVKNIHNSTQDFMLKGYKIIIVGKHQHPEVVGTQGWCLGGAIVIENNNDLTKLHNINNTKLHLVCQTTFNSEKFDELELKIKEIATQNNCELSVNKTICNAQKLINLYSVELAKESDVMIVVGGKNSSNSTELFKNVSHYCPSIFIEDINTYKTELENNNIKINKNTRIGITAGASTLKEELIELKNLIELDLKQ